LNVPGSDGDMVDQDQTTNHDNQPEHGPLPSFELFVHADHLTISVDIHKQFEDPENEVKELIPQIREKLTSLKIEETFFVSDMKRVILKGINEDEKPVIARKEIPETGEVGRIEFLVPIDQTHGETKGTQSKDPKDLGTTARIVVEGSDLVQIVKAKQPEPYVDIFGNEMEAEPIEQIQVPQYDKQTICMVDNENGWLLQSTKKGYFQRFDGQLEISSQIIADRVDFGSVGNVLGDGFIDIQINGNPYDDQDTICEGFHLVGNRISIKGNLGNGVILEGNDIEIKGKIRPNCKIVARNSLTGDYVQGAHIESGSVKLNTCWFTEINGTNILIRRDLVGSKLFGEKAVLLGEVKNSSVMMTDGISVARTDELEPSRFIISPFAIKKNRLRFEKLKENVERAKKAIYKTQTELEEQKRIGTSLIKNIISNVSRLNMKLYNNDQREKIGYLLKVGKEATWLQSLKVSSTIEERLAELQPIRKLVQDLTSKLALENTHLKMSETALLKVSNQGKRVAVFAMNDLLQGCRVLFGETEHVITDSRVGSYHYYYKNGVIGSKEFKIKPASLKPLIENVSEYLAALMCAAIPDEKP